MLITSLLLSFIPVCRRNLQHPVRRWATGSNSVPDIAAAALRVHTFGLKLKMEQHFLLNFDRLFSTDWGKKDSNGGARSILVRDLPNHLSSEQSTEALRQLFSGIVRRANYLQVNPKDGQKNQGDILLVPAKQGSLAQSSWRASRLNPKEDTGDAAQRKIPLSNGHRKQLLQQLPYAVSSIRVATDVRGGSIYAVVNFAHEILASLALQLLGETATLPNTSTWGPLVDLQ